MKDQSMEVVALDFVAAMTYQTKLNVDALERKCMMLPTGSLKDATIGFVNNQKTWLSKLLRGLRQCGLEKNMQRDLDSTDIAYYSIVCEYARQTHDLQAAANIMEYVSEAEQVPVELQEQIIQLLKPYKK
jgi:hypothetical protein